MSYSLAHVESEADVLFLGEEQDEKVITCLTLLDGRIQTDLRRETRVKRRREKTGGGEKRGTWMDGRRQRDETHSQVMKGRANLSKACVTVDTINIYCGIYSTYENNTPHYIVQ